MRHNSVAITGSHGSSPKEKENSQHRYYWACLSMSEKRFGAKKKNMQSEIDKNMMSK